VVFALLSDVHGNSEALSACLKHAHENGATRFAFLGDFVGYGADAAEVVSNIMDYAARGAIVVKGNHDEAIESRTPTYMNEPARRAIDWARESLGAQHKTFLASLPLYVREGEMCFVHASAAAPARWDYIDSPSAAMRSSQSAGTAYTFSGHVHEQILYPQVAPDRMTQYIPVPGSPVQVPRHRSWLALVGSVGQPRDGRPAAAYALFDAAVPQLTFFRVPYDHLAAAQKIRQAGLPESLAYRIEKGV
jgi:diadenosine tetraphosphatase ApaH/serine/threonine PP2A family protein phosphatase